MCGSYWLSQLKSMSGARRRNVGIRKDRYVKVTVLHLRNAKIEIPHTFEVLCDIGQRTETRSGPDSNSLCISHSYMPDFSSWRFIHWRAIGI